MQHADNRLAGTINRLFSRSILRQEFSFGAITFFGFLAPYPERYRREGWRTDSRIDFLLTVNNEEIQLTRGNRISSGSTQLVVVGIYSFDQYTTTYTVSRDVNYSSGNQHERINQPR